MTLDAASLASSMVADLVREFPCATPQQLTEAAEASLSLFADARVQTFLPILARREARRALTSVAPGSGVTVVRTTTAILNLADASRAVVSLG